MLVKLQLIGLGCKGCISAVKAALEELGVVVREISLKEAEIEVPEGISVEKCIEAIREAGYDAKPL